MRTVDDISGEVYNRFIYEALQRSDMFSFVIYWITDENIQNTKKFASSLPVGSWERDIYTNKKIPELELELEIFKRKGMEFIKSFEPYVLQKRLYRKEEKWFLKSDPLTLPLLLEPKSIYSWRVPYFVDNIAFLKNGRYWFYTTTHSYDVNFSLDSLEEVRFWESIGIEFFDEFDPNEKKVYLTT